MLRLVEVNQEEQTLFFKDYSAEEDILLKCEHYIDCCEYNYADFTQIEGEAYNHKYDIRSFHIEVV